MVKGKSRNIAITNGNLPFIVLDHNFYDVFCHQKIIMIIAAADSLLMKALNRTSKHVPSEFTFFIRGLLIPGVNDAASYRMHNLFLKAL